MKTLWIIRHGESSSNAGEVSRNNHDVHLTNNGKNQAAWIGEHFPYIPSNIFVSSFPRTAETAAPLCMRFNLKPIIRTELTEFSPLGLSVLGGMNGRQRAEAYEHFWNTATPEAQIGDDGEAFSKLNHRIDTFLANLDDYPHESVIFGHSIWIKVLAWKLLGFPVEQQSDMPKLRRFQHAFPTPNCGVFRIDIAEDNRAYLTALPNLTPPSARLDTWHL